jgi:hypothetical protein
MCFAPNGGGSGGVIVGRETDSERQRSGLLLSLYLLLSKHITIVPAVVTRRLSRSLRFGFYLFHLSLCNQSNSSSMIISTTLRRIASGMFHLD